MKSNENIIYFNQKKFNIRILLSLLTVVNGLWVAIPVLYKYFNTLISEKLGFLHWVQEMGFFHLLDLPRFVLGLILTVLGIGLYKGARVAWVFSVFFLLLLTIIDIILNDVYVFHGIIDFILLLALVCFWRAFPEHSMTNSMLVSLSSIAGLVLYSVVGSLYLGREFKPEITDIFQAFYFSMVSMTTVGYGDILPVSVASRAFTISVVVLGITIFTASILYLVGVVEKDTREIVQKRLSRMKNHYVIVGSSLLARYVYQGLKKRNVPVIVVCKEDSRDLFPQDAMVVVGDISEVETLKNASAQEAQCVMALDDSDIENTYILLAIKEMTNKNINTVTVINDENNRKKIQLLNINYVFSLSELSGEILMKSLSGEEINSDIINKLLIGNIKDA